jgi:flagellar basal-body rod protein FlgB
MISFDKLAEPVFGLMEKALNLRTRRQELISSNLANLDTPGYTRKDFNFEETLSNCLSNNKEGEMLRTNSRHLPVGTINPPLDLQESKEPVDIDKEMVKLTQNQLQYQATIHMLTKKLEGLKAVMGA